MAGSRNKNISCVEMNGNKFNRHLLFARVGPFLRICEQWGQCFLFHLNNTSHCDKCIFPFSELKNIGLKICFNKEVHNIKGPVNVEDKYSFNWIIHQIVTNMFCSFEELEKRKEVGTSLLRCRQCIPIWNGLHPSIHYFMLRKITDFCKKVISTHFQF